MKVMKSLNFGEVGADVCVAASKTTFFFFFFNFLFMIRHVLTAKVHRAQDTLKFTVASDLHKHNLGCDTPSTLMGEIYLVP